MNKHYQSRNNNEGHNQQESNDNIDDKDNIQSDNTEDTCMDGVLNRLIDAVSEIAGLGITVSLNDPSITDHDNTIPAKNGKAKKMREQKETERVVFRNFWNEINAFYSNTPFHFMHSKFVVIALESFDLKQCQIGRVDTFGKKMSIKARYIAFNFIFIIHQSTDLLFFHHYRIGSSSINI
eukprot:scaffold50946_cov66-Attheya_sp.AAC.4